MYSNNNSNRNYNQSHPSSVGDILAGHSPPFLRPPPTGGSAATPHPSAVPPLPPRPNETNSLFNRQPYFGNSYGNFGTQYSGYPSSLYSNQLNPLSGFGFNRFNGHFFGNNNNSFGESDITRIADESCRPAFQSIESIVQAFASVSMMLESTYFAVHNSFRAIVGVADHMTRVRQHLSQIVSALAIIRTLKWIIRRFLQLFGVRVFAANGSGDDSTERAWSQAFGDNTNSIANHLRADGTFNAINDSPSELATSGHSVWPVVVFFSTILGMPWLIWKLLSTITGTPKPASDKWLTGEDEHYEAIALYDFRTELNGELAFTVGQRLRVAPKDLQPRVRGWLLATIDGKSFGLIPANYVKIVNLRNPKKQQ
ncbi:peroxisomal membrane protein PEX13-like [Oppia nitens]|uniref:peroxisomal membrane protein PEX13-like n=1 Tax=Oppia nitens TaxID=1686743 RepID=UPI0023D9B88D|nr:peroxisomal membrane protein PEX13-like [Oppia nitens]